MSLRYAMLGLIAELDGASGYDLLKVFEISLGTVWQATQSQLYGELARLTEAGLIEVSAEGARRRKEYAITEAGRAELRHWLIDVPPKPNPRDEPLLRIFFLNQIEPDEALDYLNRMADALTERTKELQNLENTVPWEEGGALADNGRLTMEYGKRFLAMRRDWYIWAREQFQARVEAAKAE
ncbi:helix-turn-helix transcriptional regulator [Actinoallomurus oryzae]|uniref:Helix-turn-helix transcriptional regulator n=2 Tax=Actinoallomurus oryzae TaxID=502180 RepID=A0ABP8QSN8_9ACTN